ncbi:M15 family metallopeptidase [uncultured Algibacter sp.]|uniref:M15 family metallopeptidase n=1 Tax=uncultured Algibacter sp. TaxID=298659 RepID=UPI003217D3B4
MKNFILLASLFIVLHACNQKKTTLKQIAKVETKVAVAKKTDSSKQQQQQRITKAFVLGKFNYKTDTSFVKANAIYTTKTIYLKNTVYKAFIAMYNHAKSDGITLKMVSGTRNFYEQKAIWERKWHKYANLTPIKRAKKILEFSSMPTTSRHHWGTDIDINNLNNSYFEKGQGKTEYDWLVNNANKYGFYQVYTTKGAGRTGYNLERWHWSYLPLSSQYLEVYNTSISYQDINGFKGSKLAESLNIITYYVNGISEQIKLLSASKK